MFSDPDPARPFHELLDDLIQTSTRTGKAVAVHLSLQPARVSNWRTGKAHPTEPQIKKVASFLGLSRLTERDLLEAWRKADQGPVPLPRELAEGPTNVLSQLLDAINMTGSTSRMGLLGKLLTRHLVVLGRKLVPLTAGEKVDLSAGELETIVSLFYELLGDTYVGVDSHMPTRFREVHPLLLNHLFMRKDDSPELERCYKRRVARILAVEMDELDTEWRKGGEARQHAIKDYFNRHERADALLFRIDPDDAQKLRRSVGDLWTTDIGLWTGDAGNPAALLFSAEVDPQDEVSLQLRFPDLGDEERIRLFGVCLTYVESVLHQATRLNLVDDGWHEKLPQTEDEEEREEREDLIWQLHSLFEPRLAAEWVNFVSPEQRLKNGEEKFLIEQLDDLRDARDPTEIAVLDAAAGVGSESVFLASKGYSVTANEIDWRLVRELRQRVSDSSISLRETNCDWRHLHRLQAKFDVIVCLGNSLTCMLDPKEMKRALQSFRAVLKDGGRLLLDERNYRYFFKHAQKMLHPSYRIDGRVVYCGQLIKAKPLSIEDHDRPRIVMGYYQGNSDNAGTGHLIGTFELYPFHGTEIESMLAETGFSVKAKLNDFGTSDEESAEFVTYVAEATAAALASPSDAAT